MNGADAADIYVRGIATFTGSSSPLIQVDGVEREMSQIDPNEIESITVLKDAMLRQFSVYVAQWCNFDYYGKRGAEGKAKISFSTSVGVNVRTKEFGVCKFVSNMLIMSICGKRMMEVLLYIQMNNLLRSVTIRILYFILILIGLIIV